MERKTKAIEKSPGKILLKCLECDKTFRRVLDPSQEHRCPKCGSVDIDLG